MQSENVYIGVALVRLLQNTQNNFVCQHVHILLLEPHFSKHHSKPIMASFRADGLKISIVLRACLQGGRVTLASGLTPAGG